MNLWPFLLKDGTELQLKSAALQTYVCAENGGGMDVVLNRTWGAEWETFQIWSYSPNTFSLRVHNSMFMTVLSNGSRQVVATASEPPGVSGRFTFTRNGSRVHIKAYNGMYLQAKDAKHLTADYVSSSEPRWDDNSATFDLYLWPFNNDGSKIQLNPMNTLQTFEAEYSNHDTTDNVSSSERRWDDNSSTFDTYMWPFFKDGSEIQLKSTTLQTYVCAKNGGGTHVLVKTTRGQAWETFQLWSYSPNTFSLRVINSRFMTVLNNASRQVVATATDPPGESGRFTFTRNGSRVHIKAYNGMYLQANDANQLTSDYASSSEPRWDDNSATFDMYFLPFSNDGTEIQLKSTTLQKFVCAKNKGETHVAVNSTRGAEWETFQIWSFSPNTFSLRVNKSRFMTVLNNASRQVVATASEPLGESERFTFTRNASRVHIKASNGMYLQAKNANSLTADYVSSSEPRWDDNSATFDVYIWPFLRHGSEIQLKSTTLQTFVCADNGKMVVNRTKGAEWETFQIWGSKDTFRVGYMMISKRGSLELVHSPSTPHDKLGRFKFTRNSNRVHIKASNGMYIQAQDTTRLTADYVSSSEPGWDDNSATFYIYFCPFLRDGSNIRLKSTTLHTFVCAENGGGTQMVVNRREVAEWETFKVWRYSADTFNIRVHNNESMTISNNGSKAVVTTSKLPSERERFTITSYFSRVHIKAYNGMFLQAKNIDKLTADYKSSSEPGWDDNPATFKITRLNQFP